jgi:hypothetical protein
MEIQALKNALKYSDSQHVLSFYLEYAEFPNVQVVSDLAKIGCFDDQEGLFNLYRMAI